MIMVKIGGWLPIGDSRHGLPEVRNSVVSGSLSQPGWLYDPADISDLLIEFQ